MASISKQPNGRRTIQFVGNDGKRRSIRLGKCSQRLAETVQVKVEHLAAAQATGGALDGETARWVAGIDDVLHARLAAVGLVHKRQRAADGLNLADFIHQYIAARPGLKPNTLKNYRQTERVLVDYFGPGRLLTEITPGDCDDWKAHQEAKGHAQATIGRNVRRARQYFRAAVRKKLIADNPMQDVKAPSQVNTARMFYVSREVTERIIAACPDVEWRLIVALARYGGLRTPSETFALTWADVNWADNRIRVPSPKTACHPGGESRTIPLFPELKPHLETVFDEAEPGTVHVIAKHRIASANLRTTFVKICRRAGVQLWERCFQNMRASRETELSQDYPMHVVCSWIGNSTPIALKHYLTVIDADYEKAVQNPVQQPSESGRKRPQQETRNPGFSGVCDTLLHPTREVVPPTGVEPVLSD